MKSMEFHHLWTNGATRYMVKLSLLKGCQPE